MTQGVEPNDIFHNGVWYNRAGGGGVVTSEVDPVTGGISISANGGTYPVTIFGATGAFDFLNRPDVMAFGNSISRQNQPGYSTAGQTIAYAAYWWALGFAGWPFRWTRTGVKQQIGTNANSQMAYGAYGYSGATSATLMGVVGGTNYFDLTVKPNAPKFAILQMMENDVVAIAAGTITRAQALSAYDLALSECFAMGTRPIWIGCLPSLSFDDTTSVSASLHSTEYWALTKYIEARAAVDPRIIYVPVADLYMDTTSILPKPASTGNFANYTDSSVHPQIAAVWIGKRISDVLAQRGISGWANFPRAGSPNHIFGNSLVMGTAGTLTNYTGSGPTGLTITNSVATPTLQTVSKVMVNNRECAELNIASATLQTGIVNLAQINPTSSPATKFSVGDYLQAFAEIELRSETAPVGFRGYQFNLVYNGGGGTVGVSNLWTDTWDLPFPVNTRFLAATPEIAVTASTTSVSAQLYLKASNAAANIAAKMRLHQFAILNGSV